MNLSGKCNYIVGLALFLTALFSFCTPSFAYGDGSGAESTQSPNWPDSPAPDIPEPSWSGNEPDPSWSTGHELPEIDPTSIYSEPAMLGNSPEPTDYSGQSETIWWKPKRPYEVWPRKRLLERATELKEYLSQLSEQDSDPTEVTGVERELKRVETMLNRTWGTHLDRS